MSGRRQLVLVGSGSQVRDVADIVLTAGEAGLHRYDLVGVLADEPTNEFRLEAFGLRVLGPTEALGGIDADYIVAIGSPTFRSEVQTRLSGAAPGRIAAAIVHPSASVGRTSVLARGSVIYSGVSVGTGCTIGEGVLVCANATIGHDSVIDAFSTMLPGCIISGGSHIGRRVLVGAGAVCRERLRIGDDAQVGAGSLVTSDLPVGVVAFGSPARVTERVPNANPFRP